MSISLDSGVYAFWTILISELGDKTFMLLFALSQKNSASILVLANMMGMAPLIIACAYVGNLLKFLPLFYVSLLACVCFLGFSILCFVESYKEYKKSKRNTQKKVKKDKYESLLEQKTWYMLLFSTATAIFCLEITDSSELALFSISMTYEVVGVIIGSFVAHLICAVLAVIAGKIVAKYVSEVYTHLIVGIFFLWLFVYWGYLTIEEGIEYFGELV